VEPARSIARLGFRRWYERRLIEGHAWLITSILCAIAISVSLEGLSFRESVAGGLLTAAFVFVAALICWQGVRRYGALMRQAERLAEHSTCAACSAYGRFKMLSEFPRMTVRCRKCGNEWDLDPERSLRD
jgi:hypothetical protein